LKDSILAASLQDKGKADAFMTRELIRWSCHYRLKEDFLLTWFNQSDNMYFSPEMKKTKSGYSLEPIKKWMLL
jgi:hypothetical protein